MNSHEQAALTELVAQDQQRTSARIAALNRELEDIVENAKMSNGDDEHDPEGATIGFERSQVIALLDQARAHATELAWAAERIQSATYGQCERCGGPIAFERLEAVPTVTTCVACAAARSRRR